jgi:hypothetical protein
VVRALTKKSAIRLSFRGNPFQIRLWIVSAYMKKTLRQNWLDVRQCLSKQSSQTALGQPIKRTNHCNVSIDTSEISTGEEQLFNADAALRKLEARFKDENLI